MTINEIKQNIRFSISDHKLVHIRPDYVDCEARILTEAFEQIQKSVIVCRAGLEDPKEHRAEALLLMILARACFHGYTPS